MATQTKSINLGTAEMFGIRRALRALIAMAVSFGRQVLEDYRYHAETRRLLAMEPRLLDDMGLTREDVLNGRIRRPR